MESLYEKHYRKIFNEIIFTEDVNVNDLIKNIVKANRFYRKHSTEFRELFFSDYIREIWITESPPNKDINTVEIVDALIEGNENLLALGIDERTCIKLKNVRNALVYAHCDDNALTLENIRALHKVVGKDLNMNGGNFRSVNVRAADSNVAYAKHDQIESRLDSLLRFMGATLKSIPNEEGDMLKFMIKLGAYFFSEFLLIHPFSNGNGRTASLLLHMFSKGILIVPFSLYVDTRERYIKVLELRGNGMTAPNALATYLLLACNSTAAKVNWFALAYEDEKMLSLS